MWNRKGLVWSPTCSTPHLWGYRSRKLTEPSFRSMKMSPTLWFFFTGAESWHADGSITYSLTSCALNRKYLARRRNTDVHASMTTQKEVRETSRGMVFAGWTEVILASSSFWSGKKYVAYVLCMRTVLGIGFLLTRHPPIGTLSHHYVIVPNCIRTVHSCNLMWQPEGCQCSIWEVRTKPVWFEHPYTQTHFAHMRGTKPVWFEHPYTQTHFAHMRGTKSVWFEHTYTQTHFTHMRGACKACLVRASLYSDSFRTYERYKPVPL